jgi:hypothetical protein
MTLDRGRLYRFPWNKADNPGAWVEVTDECNLVCSGCFRHRLEGHRPLSEVKQDILECQKRLNCDRIAISGGEPLLYPDILEVVAFIARQGMKPMLLTNGELLTAELAGQFKTAGLKQVYFHVDSGQKRPGWEGKTEGELNALRQRFADVLWSVGGIQCGYNVTVSRSTLKDVPEIMEWCRKNIHKVHHLSLIAFRGLPLHKDITYLTPSGPVELSDHIDNISGDPSSINLTTEEIFDTIQQCYPGSYPSAYLSGTAVPESYKFLILLNLGSRNNIYGVVGARTVEMVQVFHHLFKGRYCASMNNPRPGKKLFLLSLFDREVRKSFGSFIKDTFRNPLRFFNRIYVQCINLQQPHEILSGRVNLCDGCVNLMMHEGKMINSCRLDEYRIFGGPLTPMPANLKGGHT